MPSERIKRMQRVVDRISEKRHRPNQEAQNRQPLARAPIEDQDDKGYDRIMAEARATTRGLAVVVLAIGLTIAYWVWPDGITERTLASITFGALLRTIASGAIGLVFFVFFAMLWIDR
jgi:hypothetical protein